MPIKSLSQSSLLSFQKYSSLLAGNTAYSPGSYDLLVTQILTSSAASVTFTGLDSYTDYKHLQVRFTGRSDSTTASYAVLAFYVNGDTVNTNFQAVHYLYGNGSSAASAASTTNRAYGQIPYGLTRDGLTANSYGAGIIDILDFSNTNKNTTFRCFSGITSSALNYVSLTSNLYGVTDAITELQFITNNNLMAGSRFSIYGLKAA